ncbi:hypothetical protein [Lactobacillus sp. M0390]|nr:hypothetical protein [Lactobacillus sp. M0390]MBH9986617.1 hypothetical protein [Lactobacillus sp. M0390]MCT6888210.1 hypothetical protein [Lactobacillus sp.]QHJ81256.1 MAG: hypothetical protein [Caudoviricetes sp.]
MNANSTNPVSAIAASSPITALGLEPNYNHYRSSTALSNATCTFVTI